MRQIYTMATTTKVRSAQDSKFQNLQVNNFQCSGQYETESGVVLASRRTEGVIQLTQFALLQLINGAEVSEKVDHKLVAKLAIKLYIHTNGAGDAIEFHVTRSEVEQMKTMIESRMAHCELERDQRDDKFNPDTYIQQKFLLLDIREWLTITAIGDFKQEQEPVQEEEVSGALVPVETPLKTVVQRPTITYAGYEYLVISSEEYGHLDNPQFMGQTGVSKTDGSYHTFWNSNGNFYAVHNVL